MRNSWINESRKTVHDKMLHIPGMFHAVDGKKNCSAIFAEQFMCF